MYSKNYHQQQSKESGVVSILSVLFFMIFISIIVVGFIKIVNDDQSQSTDSDLSASALSSAQSGAEDGKRLLIMCQSASDVATKTACLGALNNPSCEAITGNPILVSAARLDIDVANNEGIVSKNNKFQQRYTCLTVQTITDSIEDVRVDKGTSELIPLESVGGNFNRVQFSWHNTSNDKDGPVGALRNNTQLPDETGWDNSGSSYPALMRLEFIAYPKTGVVLDSLQANTRTMYVAPGPNGAPAVSNIALFDQDIRETDPNGAVASRPVLAQCNILADYACSIGVQMTGVGQLDTSVYNYYLRASAVYAPAYIKLELFNSGNRLQINGTQPIIDVTGRANDVFRRVQTRVQFDSPKFYPQFALETGELCKNMLVTDVAISSQDFCNPGNPTASVCTPTPRDIVLAMDGSHSMVNLWESDTRLANQASVSRYFVNNANLAVNGNTMAVVQFSQGALKLQSLTTDKNALINAVNSPASLKYNTHYLAGLQAAEDYLTDSNSRSAASKYIVFLSDGRANDRGESTPIQRANTRDAVMAEIETFRQRGYNVYTIAITLSVNDAALLYDMRLGTGDFFLASEEAQLDAAIRAILSEIDC